MPERVESTLIWYRHGTYNGNYKEWVDRLEDSLERKLDSISSREKKKIFSLNFPTESSFLSCCHMSQSLFWAQKGSLVNQTTLSLFPFDAAAINCHTT